MTFGKLISKGMKIRLKSEQQEKVFNLREFKNFEFKKNNSKNVCLFYNLMLFDDRYLQEHCQRSIALFI